MSGTLEPKEAFRKLLEGTSLILKERHGALLITQPGASANSSTMEHGASAGASAAPEEGKSNSSEPFRVAQTDHATAAGSPAIERPREAAAANQAAALEEVVVTAQKREEHLQNVPISMSVLGGTDLDSSHFQGVADALNTVPGVVVTPSYLGGGTQVTVRGVAAGSPFFEGSSPIAYYLDGVPFGLIKSAIAPDEDVYDLQRIEVLRGPQGTLYGASALNGVVRILTNDADLNSLDFKVRASDSGTFDGGNNYRGDLAVNVPAEYPDFDITRVNSIRHLIEAGIRRKDLQHVLPPGGARNALDCAFWDLEAKLTGRFAWEIASLSEPKPLVTLFTCGADEPKRMAAAAQAYRGAKAIKLKLTSEAVDVERIFSVREARPDVSLVVDANQSYSRESLERLVPTLLAARVSLIEQPFHADEDSLLDGFRLPIPIMADESVETSADIPGLVGRFDVINIKLDKSGRLTEGLRMLQAARKFGLKTYVGNMFGTSLAMAPAYLLAQQCDWAELDGPIFLQNDRMPRVEYGDGLIGCPPVLWGGPGS